MYGQIQATFRKPEDAEMAAAVLCDFGALARDLTVIQPRGLYVGGLKVGDVPIFKAKPNGQTSIVGAATTGAAKGLVLGIAAGVLMALGTLYLPGVGFVEGRRAIATAFLGALATMAAGSVIGAVLGYLKDLRTPEVKAPNPVDVITAGGAVLYMEVPSGIVDAGKASEIITSCEGSPVMGDKGETAYVA
jgi:hypothetical protein